MGVIITHIEDVYKKLIQNFNKSISYNKKRYKNFTVNLYSLKLSWHPRKLSLFHK